MKPSSKTIVSAPSGDRTAEFVRLLTQHERRVYAYILSLVPSWADADEILQETNVRLWEQFEQFMPGADFGAWACTIAHYQVLTFRKQSARDRVRFSQQFMDLVAAEVETLNPKLESRLAAMGNCLQRLLPMQRELLTQVYGSGISTIKEVALRMGRSVAATYKSLERIRQTLHDCIDRQVPPESEG